MEVLEHMVVCMLAILNRWYVYKNIYNYLSGLKDKQLIAIIDEGRSRKKEIKCKINGIYRRIFTIESENILMSFSYSDLICKAITLNTM